MIQTGYWGLANWGMWGWCYAYGELIEKPQGVVVQLSG